MEICVETIQSAVNAADGGATQLLLCSALSEGGLTPTVGMLRAIKEKVNIPVTCMLRCRPGNYCYTPMEVLSMAADAKMLLSHGADGIAFGALTTDGAVDQKICNKILEVVPEDAQVTFHRAFDWTKDPMQAFKDIHSLERFSSILTSGQASRVEEGVDLLRQLTKRVEQCGSKISIVPSGPGVTYRNIVALVDSTGCLEFQASATHPVKFPGHLNPLCPTGTQDARVDLCRKEIVATMAHYLKCKKMDIAGKIGNALTMKHKKYLEEYAASRDKLDKELGAVEGNPATN